MQTQVILRNSDEKPYLFRTPTLSRRSTPRKGELRLFERISQQAIRTSRNGVAAR